MKRAKTRLIFGQQVMIRERERGREREREREREGGREREREGEREREKSFADKVITLFLQTLQKLCEPETILLTKC